MPGDYIETKDLTLIRAQIGTVIIERLGKDVVISIASGESDTHLTIRQTAMLAFACESAARP